MVPFQSPKEYLFNLYTTSSGDAKRIWKTQIKESWNNQCAYCGSDKNLTIDHLIPQSRGGPDFTKNVVCCCYSCNINKGNKNWEEWYNQQSFFTLERKNSILEWIRPKKVQGLYTYGNRKNNSR